MDTSWLASATNLTGRVRKTSKDPTFGGGFADVWEGDFEGRLVAIKVPRFMEMVAPEKLLKVCTYVELYRYTCFFLSC
jgi:hypothetical protein